MAGYNSNVPGHNKLLSRDNGRHDQHSRCVLRHIMNRLAIGRLSRGTEPVRHGLENDGDGWRHGQAEGGMGRGVASWMEPGVANWNPEWPTATPAGER